MRVLCCLLMGWSVLLSGCGESKEEATDAVSVTDLNPSSGTLSNGDSETPISSVAVSKPANADFSSLQGVWQASDIESVPALPPETLASMLSSMLTVRDDSFVVEQSNRGKQIKRQSSFKLDPSQSPKTIDLTGITGLRKGKTQLGIYAIDGDTLKLCTATTPSGERPKELKAIEDPRQSVVVFQRLDDSVAAIVKLGGKVTFDETKPGRPVTGVRFGSNVNDAGLEHLKGMTTLQSLSLFKSKDVTDGGLMHLKGLTSLQILEFTLTNVTDAGLVHLKGLTSLQILALRHTQVTDTGLVHLRDLTSLQTLTLNGIQVTDAGLVHLKELTNLQNLNVGSTNVADAGLEHLKGLANLRVLDLSNTKVTDAGLVHLKEMTGLNGIYFRKTGVTTTGVKDLQSALPKCKITQ